MEIEAPGSFEITKLLVIDVRLISLCQRLGKGHRLGSLAGNTRTIKIDGMIMLILEGDNDYRITRHCFIHSDINAEEKTDDKGSDNYDGKDRFFLTHSLRFQNVG